MARKRDAVLADSQTQFHEHGLNICYNKRIPKDYNSELDNLLIGTESPAFFPQGYDDDGEDWIQDDMEFVAEISWEKYSDADFHYCPRDLYATYDKFVNFYPDPSFSKDRLTSFIYSDKSTTNGHVFRHEVGDRFGEDIDCFGSGAGNFIERKIDSLADYRFQVAIENCNHPHFLSEKFFDPIKTKTVPIYRGGHASIEALGFDTDGIFIFDTLDELGEILDELSPALYEELRPSVEYNHRRLAEIRNERKLQYYLANSVQPYYLEAAESKTSSSLATIIPHMYTDSYLGGVNLRPDYVE